MKPYEDHIGLWADELKSWVPDTIFDAHVHLGPPEAVGKITTARQKEPLTTFRSFTWEKASAFYKNLYSGKEIVGLIAFGFPLREVKLEVANQYIIHLMQDNPFIKGFVISDPKDTERTIHNFEKALKAGVRFSGVKPYFDLLGKSNYETTMPEFIPNDLLEFMNSEELVMMLHTSGIGMGDYENQQFIKSVANDFPHINIVLAHMGRYLELKQFFDFIESDVMDYPSVFLEMSTATKKEVYQRVLARKELWGRLLFGSDLPYGLITGVERWSKETGPIFITRDQYSWSDSSLNEYSSNMRDRLTYNTYHTIKALKDAVDSLNLAPDNAEQLKRKIFLENARYGLFDNKA
ncbi:MAG: amidohydrolase family protein [Deltaproteobacteria bacterium]|nr:amidohydrolase family protein [Deltaproteobacteria bacterium]